MESNNLPRKFLFPTIFVLCFGVAAYMSLSSADSETLVATDEVTQEQEWKSPTVAEQAATLTEHLSYTIEGTVMKVDDTSITVKASIVDDSKLASLDYSKSNVLETVEKTFTVGITKDTQMLSKPKVGDTITIHTNESIYRSATLTAAIIKLIELIPPE